MASREMIERMLTAYFGREDWTVGFSNDVIEDAHKGMSAALDAALPQGEDVGSVVAELRRGKLFYESSGGSVYAGSTKLGRKAADLIEAQAAQIASLSAKVAEVEGERDKLSRELDMKEEE